MDRAIFTDIATSDHIRQASVSMCNVQILKKQQTSRFLRPAAPMQHAKFEQRLKNDLENQRRKCFFFFFLNSYLRNETKWEWRMFWFASVINVGGNEPAGTLQMWKNWQEIWLLVGKVNRINSSTSNSNQVREISKDGNQKNQASSEREVSQEGCNFGLSNENFWFFGGILTRVHLTGPLQCQNILLLWLPEKRLSGGGGITFFPIFLPSNYGGR